MIYAKIICLFVAVTMTTSNLLKAKAKQKVSGGHFMLMAAGITGFTTLQWLI